MYKITIDRVSSMLTIKFGGLMTVDEVMDYVNDVRREIVLHGLRSYCMVIDVQDCPLQSQAVLRAMGEHMAAMPKAWAIAIVTGDSLARMQVRRLFTQSYARIVMTVAEGQAWVLSGKEPPAWQPGRPRQGPDLPITLYEAGGGLRAARVI